MNKKLPYEELIKQFKEIHNNKYRYKKFEYINKGKDKIKIYCKKHKLYFYQTIKYHQQGRLGCPLCKKEVQKKRQFYSQEKIIERIKKVHNNKYNLSKIEYKGINNKIELVCYKHGKFWIKPNDLINNKQGCSKCGNEFRGNKQRKPLSQFIKEAIKIYGNEYDYSKVNYINCDTIIIIICKKHGEFKSSPYKHLNNNIGCPFCKTKFSFETITKQVLDIYNLNYEYQYKFSECRNQLPLPFDFAIFEDKEKTKLKFLIECQGLQHYKIIDYFGGEKGYTYRKKNDYIKKEYCNSNNIMLLEIKYPKYRDIERKFNYIDKTIKETINGFTKIN